MRRLRMARGWAELGYWVRELFGENAYPRYVAAWQAQHANTSDNRVQHPLLNEREFFSQRLERMYGDNVHRCC